MGKVTYGDQTVDLDQYNIDPEEYQNALRFFKSFGINPFAQQQEQDQQSIEPDNRRNTNLFTTTAAPNPVVDWQRQYNADRDLAQKAKIKELSDYLFPYASTVKSLGENVLTSDLSPTDAIIEKFNQAKKEIGPPSPQEVEKDNPLQFLNDYNPTNPNFGLNITNAISSWFGNQPAHPVWNEGYADRFTDTWNKQASEGMIMKQIAESPRRTAAGSLALSNYLKQNLDENKIDRVKYALEAMPENWGDLPLAKKIEKFNETYKDIIRQGKEDLMNFDDRGIPALFERAKDYLNNNTSGIIKDVGTGLVGGAQAVVEPFYSGAEKINHAITQAGEGNIGGALVNVLGGVAEGFIGAIPQMAAMNAGFGIAKQMPDSPIKTMLSGTEQIVNTAFTIPGMPVVAIAKELGVDDPVTLGSLSTLGTLGMLMGLHRAFKKKVANEVQQGKTEQQVIKETEQKINELTSNSTKQNTPLAPLPGGRQALSRGELQGETPITENPKILDTKDNVIRQIGLMSERIREIDGDLQNPELKVTEKIGLGDEKIKLQQRIKKNLEELKGEGNSQETKVSNQTAGVSNQTAGVSDQTAGVSDQTAGNISEQQNTPLSPPLSRGEFNRETAPGTRVETAPGTQIEAAPGTLADQTGMGPIQLTKPEPVPVEKAKSGLVYVDTKDVKVHPEMQFKLNADESGITRKDKLETSVYDPKKAGTYTFWKDPVDGQTYVVDGHHRLDLATRTGEQKLPGYYVDAKNINEARSEGALINIANGKGTPVDVARFLKEYPNLTPEEMAKKGVVIKEGSDAKKGAMLSELNNTLLQKVENSQIYDKSGEIWRKDRPGAVESGLLDMEYAIEISKRLKDPELQMEAYKKLADGKIGLDTFKEMLDEKQHYADQGNTPEADMFGNTGAKDLEKERAEIVSFVKGEMTKNLSVANIAKSEKRGEIMKERDLGNLNAQKGKEEAGLWSRYLELFDKSRYSDLSETINQYAERLQNAKNTERTGIKNAAYSDIRDQIEGLNSRWSGEGDKGAKGLFEQPFKEPEPSGQPGTETGSGSQKEVSKHDWSALDEYFKTNQGKRIKEYWKADVAINYDLSQLTDQQRVESLDRVLRTNVPEKRDAIMQRLQPAISESAVSPEGSVIDNLLNTKPPVVNADQGVLMSSVIPGVNIKSDPIGDRINDFYKEEIKTHNPTAELESSRINRPSVIQKSLENLEKFAHQFTRSFEHLDIKKPVDATADYYLKQIKNLNGFASSESVQLLKDITKDLNKPRMQLMEDILIGKDLARNVDEGLYKGKELPFGFKDKADIDNFTNKRAELAQKVAPEVLKASDTRNSVMTEIVQNQVKRGWLPESALKNIPSYWHHQVLDYVNAKSIGKSTQSLKIPEMGYQKARKGSSMKYNRDYIESEYEVMRDMIYKERLYNYVEKMKDIDIRKNVERMAQEKSAKEGREVKWSEVIPEGYVKWRPENGHPFDKAKSIAERLIDKQIEMQMESEKIKGFVNDDGFIETKIPDDVKTTWVIPENVAKAFNDFKDQSVTEGKLGEASKFINNAWKTWAILRPMKYIRYRLRNTMSDLSVAVDYPGIFRDLPRGIAESWNVFRKKSWSPDAKEAIERGVLDAGQFANEIPDFSKQFAFSYIKGNRVKDIPKKVWDEFAGFNNFVENTLRMAGYKYFKREMAKGKKIYGAANRAQVDVLKDVRDKAALVTNETFIDYKDLSKNNKFIKDHLIPFWTWQVKNAPRLIKMIKNAPFEDRGLAGKISGTALGGAGMVVKSALTSSLTTVALSSLFAASQIYNHLVHPDEQKDLTDEAQRKGHIIIGRSDDGSVQSLDLETSIGDALDIPGFSDPWGTYEKIKSGEKKLSDLPGDMAKSVVNRYVNQMLPIEKSVFEAGMGKTLSPDAFKPRTLYDRYEHIANSWGMGEEYKHLAGKPVKSTKNILKSALITEYDPKETAYFNVKDRAQDFLKMKGIEQTGGGEPTERQVALYYFKKSKQIGDTDGQKKYLRKYAESGGKMEGLKTSIRMAKPGSEIPNRLKSEFMKWMKDKGELNIVTSALAYYKKLYGVE